jgi:hypothetical protein
VIGLVSGTVSSAARSMGHYIAFGLTSFLMILVIIFIARGLKYRRGKWWQRNGPLTMVILAALLILADPSRHVLQDIGAWPPPGSSQYRWDCDSESIRCLSVVGWIFTIGCTYIGFTLLVIGTLWNANIISKCRKIKTEWHRIRSSNDGYRRS